MPTEPLHAPLLQNPSFLAFLALIACACVFFIFFVLRPRPKTPHQRRDPSSAIGILFQCLSYALLGILHRTLFTPLFPMPLAAQWILAAFTILLAVSSLAFCIAAVLTLGRQWTYIAAVSPQHQLITRGPYRLVRHPIYSGMFGLAIATALALSHWWALPPALALLALGTWIRIHKEDALLKSSHGPRFNAYATRVPALFPRLCRKTEPVA